MDEGERGEGRKIREETTDLSKHNSRAFEVNEWEKNAHLIQIEHWLCLNFFLWKRAGNEFISWTILLSRNFY